MTEYDYSPEAYERFLATQRRIANWVDTTEQHRSEFQHAVPTAHQQHTSGHQQHPSYDSHPRPRHSPPPPRQLYINVPSPESVSSDGYSDGPGPMPRSAPAMMLPHQQPMFHPMAPPMAPPPMMMMPPTTYITSPQGSWHHRRRSQSHSRSRSHRSPTYYNFASPPVSPGYQYGYPPVMGGAHPGYIMMPPQQGRQVPIMSELPRSAPPSFSPAGNTAGGYFQLQPQHLQAPTANLELNAAFTAPPSMPSLPISAMSGFGQRSTYGIGSPTHSITSGLTGDTSLVSQPQIMSQYQGMQFAFAQTSVPPFAAQSLVVPQGVHQRVYDLRDGRHYVRRSIG